MKPRRQLIKAIAVMLFLLVVIALTENLLPDQINLSEYQYIREYRIASSPESFEGEKISTNVEVSQIKALNSSFYLITTEKELILECPVSFNLSINDVILVRGVSFLDSKGVIEVDDIFRCDFLAFYYSVPGIILFIIIFFYFFTFDFNKLVFSPRRNE